MHIPQYPPPPFTGDKPRSWLLQIEQCFAIVGVPDEEKLSRIVCHLSGSPLEHYNATKERSPETLPRTWEEFKTYSIDIYGSVSEASVVQKLREIPWTGDVRAVVDQFQDALGWGINPLSANW